MKGCRLAAPTGVRLWLERGRGEERRGGQGGPRVNKGLGGLGEVKQEGREAREARGTHGAM
eukprot:COSAG02_NODE_1204_length_13898_cov_42.005870_4_plen_61_part_00